MNKLKVGIVGYGWAAGAHIGAINSGEQAQVTAICSSRTLDPAELSSRHGSSIHVYNDYEKMLAEGGLDVVSVCSYHQQHKDHIIAAARAGKHIIAEKPLALTWSDVCEIEREVTAANVRFCICFELRFSTQFTHIKQMLERGLLGHVHYAEIDYYHGVGPWYREFEWCTTIEGCGSSLLEAGCHAMDALLLCIKSPVEEVFTYGANSVNATFLAYEYPSTTATLINFTNGQVGKVASVIDCWQPYYFHTHLVGSEGSLLDNKYHSNLEHGLTRDQWKTLPFKPVDSGDVSDHPYKTQFDTFFTAIKSGTDMPLTGLKEAVRTHEVIFAAERSLKERRPVKLAEMRTQ